MDKKKNQLQLKLIESEISSQNQMAERGGFCFLDSDLGMNNSDIIPPSPDNSINKSWNICSEPIDLAAEEVKAIKVAKLMENNILPSFKVKSVSHWTTAGGTSACLPVTPIKPPDCVPHRQLFPEAMDEDGDKHATNEGSAENNEDYYKNGDEASNQC